MIAQARRFPGQEQTVLEFLRKNPQAQESLAAPILEDKVIDFILEMAQVSERTVSGRRVVAGCRRRNHICSERGRAFGHNGPATASGDDH